MQINPWANQRTGRSIYLVAYFFKFAFAFVCLKSTCFPLIIQMILAADDKDFLCKNCKYKQHQCFACGKLGSSDLSSEAEVGMAESYFLKSLKLIYFERFDEMAKVLLRDWIKKERKEPFLWYRKRMHRYPRMHQNGQMLKMQEILLPACLLVLFEYIEFFVFLLDSTGVPM